MLSKAPQPSSQADPEAGAADVPAGSLLTRVIHLVRCYLPKFGYAPPGAPVDEAAARANTRCCGCCPLGKAKLSKPVRTSRRTPIPHTPSLMPTARMHASVDSVGVGAM